MELTSFEKLINLNVNDKIEKRSDGKVELSYLSWTFAWSEFKKVFPKATYESSSCSTFSSVHGIVSLNFSH